MVMRKPLDPIGIEQETGYISNQELQKKIIVVFFFHRRRPFNIKTPDVTRVFFLILISIPHT